MGRPRAAGQPPRSTVALLCLLGPLLCGAGSGDGTSRHTSSGDGTSRRITTLHITGERHTGTNHLRSILQACLEPSVAVVDGLGTGGEKHNLQPPPGRPMPGSLIVAAVRNAFDWTVALHRRCYCCTELQALPFAAFLHASFTSTDWSPECAHADVDRRNGNRPFASALAARRAKLEHLAFLASQVGGVELVRLEDVWQAQASGSSTAQLLRERLARYELPWRECSAGEQQQQQTDARAWLAHSRPYSAAQRLRSSLYIQGLETMAAWRRAQAQAQAEPVQAAAATPAAAAAGGDDALRRVRQASQPLQLPAEAAVAASPRAPWPGLDAVAAAELEAWRVRALGSSELPDPVVLLPAAPVDASLGEAVASVFAAPGASAAQVRAGGGFSQHAHARQLLQVLAPPGAAAPRLGGAASAPSSVASRGAEEAPAADTGTGAGVPRWAVIALVNEVLDPAFEAALGYESIQPLREREGSAAVTEA